MDHDEEKIKAIALGTIPGIGHYLARQLLEHCGTATKVFSASSSRLRRIPGIGPKTAKSVRNVSHYQLFAAAEEELNWCRKHSVSILTILDDGFPERLRHCTDGPYLIFMKGDVNLNHLRVIGIVGSRKATPSGIHLTNTLVNGLKDIDVIAVSGLAMGIDGSAHRSCLQHRVPTVGVLAHGLNMIYPAVHRQLAEQIIQQGGGLLTEYRFATRPERMHFPARNRIVAGLCDAIVVVESAENGGALITADIANSYDRDVFAYPGRPDDLLSAGCNHLIVHHKAALIRSADDLLRAMNWESEWSTSRPKVKSNLQLNSIEQIIYDRIACAREGIHTDELMKAEALNGQNIRSHLLNLEFKGVIRALPGNSFEKV